MGYSTKSCIFASASSQYVTLGNNLGFERTASRTISFWAKWTASGTQTLIGKIDEGTTYTGYQIVTNAGKLEVWLINDQTGANYLAVQTNSTFNTGAWRHICVTYNGGSAASGVKIYVDGALQATTTLQDTLSASIITTAALYFGGRATSTSHQYYDGSIDDVVFYDRVFTAAEVFWLYAGGPRDLSTWGPTSNLIGRWRMGDGDTYPTLTDSSSGGHNGTMTNMSAGSIVSDPATSPNTLPPIDHYNWRFKVNIPVPYSRKCLAFTGSSSQYVTLGNNFSFEYTNTFSVSFWAKWSANALYSLVAKQGDTTYRGWAVYMDASGHIGFQLVNTVSGSLYLDVVTTGTFTTSAWHHICITYSGSGAASGVTIYVDGSSQTKTTNSDTLGTNTIVTTNALYLGGRASSGSNQYFTGSLDEVAIYNSTLSSTDVTALYNGKNPSNLNIISTPSPSNLIGWWRMGDGDTAPTITDASSGGHNGTMTNTPVITSDWPTSGSVQTDHSNLLRAIKDSLITSTGWTDCLGNSATVDTPWTVVASSNGTVANTSDNWTKNSDLVYAAAGSNHSWIVLQQSALGYQLCIDLNNVNTYRISMCMSFSSGFSTSSLSTTNRPTAADESPGWSSVTWFNGNASFNAVLNVQMTSDGYMTRHWGLVSTACKEAYLCEKPKNTVSGWSTPVISCWVGGTSYLYTSINDNPWTAFRAKNINGWFYLSCEFYGTAAVGQSQTVVNSLSSEWVMSRIGCLCANPGLMGRHGEVSDMWYGSVTPATGDTYPSTGTLKQFIHIKDVIFPWNQSTPLLT